MVNGRKRTLLFYFYFANRIYPDFAIFVKTVRQPMSDISTKENAFAKAEDDLRKNIERAFSVLIMRFQILKQPCRLWNQDDMMYVMKSCIILHNVIV